MNALILPLLLIAQADSPLSISDKEGAADAPAEVALDDSVVPPEQKVQAKLFAGTWRCEGKAMTDYSPEVQTRVTLSFKSELGGRFIGVKIEEAKSKQNPTALTSTELWGYSGALGGWVRNGADTQGGFYAGTSAGFIGDRFWWTTQTVRNGKRAISKDTITKVSDKAIAFERAIEAAADGGMRVVYEGTCKR